MAIDTDTLRADEFRWMCSGDTVYMNAASTGPLPQRSVDAQVDFTRRRATPHLVGFDDQFGALARCRALVAEMVNASATEIALGINTGAGMNLAAWGLPLGRGDEVVVPDAEFPANRYPWMAASEAKGFALHVVPSHDGLLDNDALFAALERPRVRALSVSWVGFSNGAVADLDRLGAACRDREIYFVVDGIQGLGACTLDLEKTPVDVFACGAQKWLLGPWGSGFTYVRRGIMDEITPQPVSWMAVRGSDDFSKLIDYDLTWRDDARRFEQVTLPYQDFAGMAASLELLREIGPHTVSEHILRCAHELLEGARERGVSLVTPLERHAGTASVRPSDATAVSAGLDAAGVIHSVREGTIRLAPHCYTNEEDIQRTLAALSGE
ncbi:MAG: aminotransferase class V-fold PLP-dependent enzyme [bacterium]